MATLSLTPYEQSALDDLVESSSPWRTPVAACAHLATAPTSAAAGGEAAHKDDHLAFARIARAVLGRVAGWSRLTLPRRGGAEGPAARRDLWEVDEAARPLMPKYVALGALLGASSGYGLRAWAATLPLTLGLAMRCVQEHAQCYGFVPGDRDEQRWASRILVAALSPRALVESSRQDNGVEGDDMALAQIAEGGSRVASLLAAGLKIGRRLLRTSSVASSASTGKAQRAVASLAGAALHGWLFHGIARTASLVYRDRYVARRHGAPVPLLPAKEAALD